MNYNALFCSFIDVEGAVQQRRSTAVPEIKILFNSAENYFEYFFYSSQITDKSYFFSNGRKLKRQKWSLVPQARRHKCF